jgi:hypothetical protein
MLLNNSFTALPTKNHIFLLECNPYPLSINMVRDKNE